MSVLVLCMSCLCLWLGKVSGIIVSSCSWESRCLQLSVLVSADYVVQVEMVSYSNPSNTRSDGQCCDSPQGFDGVEPCVRGERCDTYFIYCLMPRFSTTVGCPRNEPGFFAFSSTSIVDGADIDFSQPTVLGLSNPFNLTGISTAWGVMISLLCYCISIYHLLNNCRELSFTYQWVILIDSVLTTLLWGFDLI